MLSAKEIEITASILGNQLSAGIPARQIMARMPSLQKKYKEQWEKAAQKINDGEMFSEGLRVTEMFPDSVLSAIIAGEHSGKLVEILNQIEETMQLEQKVRSVIFKIFYPLSLVLGGLMVFCFYMIKVLPNITKMMGNNSSRIDPVSQFFLDLSSGMEYYYTNYTLEIFIGIIGIVVGIVCLSKNKSFRSFISYYALQIPYLSNGLYDIYFALWGKYVAFIDAAGGVGVKEKLLIPKKVIPQHLELIITTIADHVEEDGLSDSVNPLKIPEDDVRQYLPFYISTAFMVAHETGRLDIQLEKVCPAMIRDGFRNVDVFFKVFNQISLLVAATVIASPIVVYYIQLSSVMTAAMG
jgi:type II secretory pathway component PulF